MRSILVMLFALRCCTGSGAQWGCGGSNERTVRPRRQLPRFLGHNHPRLWLEALEAFESTGRTVGILQARSLPTFLPSHAYSQHSRTTERIVSRERSYCGREVTCHSMAHGDHVTAE